MKKLDSIDYKILFELMKNSRRSDRQLAKTLKTSQPTVTRRRIKLEKNFIEGYTVLPRWEKIDFELVAFTFVKTKIRYAKSEERERAIRKAREWFMKQPNVVFAIGGHGMGWDGVCISLHKSYSDFAEFIRKHDSELSDVISESQSFIADMHPVTIIKSLHFKYLAKATEK
ncbi:MAG: Lrp/AsnC family transcriptional regulator [Candidatus Bathyarchaeota archaeon]|nr:Lrp/AsnC family transcriptional regulator [Candidatus Bathyarchaeota archaeon]